MESKSKHKIHLHFIPTYTYCAGDFYSIFVHLIVTDTCPLRIGVEASTYGVVLALRTFQIGETFGFWLPGIDRQPMVVDV